MNPLTLQTLERMQLPRDGLRSKSWQEFASPGSCQLDFVFTVCDQAAGEACPVWPGQPITAHWGVTDPAAFAGPSGERPRQFMNAANTLKRRIELMLALPIERLDALALQREMQDIGKR